MGARLPLGGMVGLCAVLVGASASAQTSLNQPYPQGFALSVFEPAPAGDRFFAVADASSFSDERLRLGLVGDYPTRYVLRRQDNVTGQSANVVSSQLYLHAGAAYPITDFLHAHADVPFAAVQKGDTASSPKGGKFGDIRIGLRANLINPETEAFAFGPGVDLWIPTGSQSNLTGDGKVRVNPRLGISGRAGAFAYTANAGYLVRKKVNAGSLEFGDAFTFGAGAGVVLFDDVLQIGPELWGNRQVSSKLSGAAVTPVSALFGAKVHVGDFAFGAAAGPGITNAPGVAPRVVVSIALAPETHVKVTTDVADRDHDGILDRDDACPDKAGAAAADATKNGCPAEVAAGSDSDGDGVPDATDACPDKLGDRSPDPKLDGCPRPRLADADGDGVRDELDACPDVKGDPSSDKSKNGCPAPLADSDGDGVLDKDDACLHDAGEPTTDPKTTGCPKPASTLRVTRVKDAGDGAAVTFSGFHVFPDGTSRIYVQLTSSVAVDANVTGKKAEYLLHGARIPIRNNKNPLSAEHFVAEVVNARLVPTGQEAKGRKKQKAKTSDVRLVVEMRDAAKPQHRLVRNADGTATLVVDFPKPTKPPAPPPDPVAPTKKTSDADLAP
jgi:OOP family OmpA-OmpF porin